MTQSIDKPQSNAGVDVQKAVQDCLGCHSACLETISHCLQLGGQHAEASHIKLLMDCAGVCQITADYLVRGSTYFARMNVLCAEICDQCAKDCEQIMGDDEVMRRCVEACRRCSNMAEKTVYSGSALGTSL
jgi:hypothetical protein